MDEPNKDQKNYNFVRPGVLQSRIQNRERQNALGRGLGVLLSSGLKGDEAELRPQTQPQGPLPKLELPQGPGGQEDTYQFPSQTPEPRPFGVQRGALKSRLGGQNREQSAQGLSALFRAMPSSNEGETATQMAPRPQVRSDILAAPQTVGGTSGMPMASIGGHQFPLAQDFLIVMMDLNLIQPNPFVPLSRIDRQALDGLVESIRSHGFLRPLVVMPSTLGSVMGGQTYWLITGERSWQVARILGIESVPVRIQDVAPREAIQMVLADEWHLQHLPSMDRARLCSVLSEQMGMDADEIAGRLAIDREQVEETLLLLNLDQNIQDSLSNGHITEAVALAFAQIDDPTLRQEIFKYAVRYRWNSVRIDRALRERQEQPA